MPRILIFGQYVIYFWSSEDGKPAHVHVAIKKPKQNSTKFWLTKSGGCELSANDGSIPAKDLKRIQRFIALNHSLILEAWKNQFDNKDIRFYK